MKLSRKNADEYFALLDTIGGVSIWSERALASKIDSSGYTKISLKKGLMKGLTIEFNAELIGKPWTCRRLKA